MKVHTWVYFQSSCFSKAVDTKPTNFQRHSSGYTNNKLSKAQLKIIPGKFQKFSEDLLLIFFLVIFIIFPIGFLFSYYYQLKAAGLFMYKWSYSGHQALEVNATFVTICTPWKVLWKIFNPGFSFSSRMSMNSGRKYCIIYIREYGKEPLAWNIQVDV